MKHFYYFAAMSLLAFSATAQHLSGPRRASAELQRPVVLPATNITSNGFTANWEPVSGAEAYCVFVYIKDVAVADGEYTLVDEDFDGIDTGSLIEPAGGDEYGVNLSQYGYALSYGWEAYAYPTFAPSLVAGLLYTPYLYLVNDGGLYQLHITTYSNQGDKIRVESHGVGDKQTVIYDVELDNSQAQGLMTKTLEFDNGSRDLFCSMINVTADIGVADYFDRIRVTQNLKAGDEIYTNIAGDEAVMAEDDYGHEVTSKRFTLPAAYLNGKTEVYYDVYAALYEGTELVMSDYSRRVLVDLKNRTSKVLEDKKSGVSTIAVPDVTEDTYYDLTGRPVASPERGIFIRNGQKIVK